MAAVITRDLSSCSACLRKTRTRTFTRNSDAPAGPPSLSMTKPPMLLSFWFVDAFNLSICRYLLLQTVHVFVVLPVASLPSSITSVHHLCPSAPSAVLFRCLRPLHPSVIFVCHLHPSPPSIASVNHLHPSSLSIRRLHPSSPFVLSIRRLLPSSLSVVSVLRLRPSSPSVVSVRRLRSPSPSVVSVRRLRSPSPSVVFVHHSVLYPNAS